MSLNPVTPVTNRGVKTPWLSTEPPAGTTVLAVDEDGVKSQTAADTRTLLGLATVATSASATDLSTGTLDAARLPASAVTTAGSYANPAWITSLAASKITSLVTYPKFRKLVLLGDSITDMCGGVRLNGTVENNYPNGYFTSARWFLNQRFPSVINAGVSGDTTTMIAARIAAVTATSPDVVVVFCGINDCLGADVNNVSSIITTAQNNLTAIYDALTAANAYIVAIPIWPISKFYSGMDPGTYPRLAISRINAWIYKQAETRGNFLVADTGAAFRNLNTNHEPFYANDTTIYPGGYPGYLSDGIHPSATAAFAAGKLLADILDPLFPGGTLNWPGDETENYIPNSDLRGAVDSPRSPPTSFTFNAIAGGATSTISYVDRTDGIQGRWFRSVQTVGYGLAATCYKSPTWMNTNDVLIAEAEVRVVSGFVQPYLELDARDLGAASHAIHRDGYRAGAVVGGADVTIESAIGIEHNRPFVLRTPPVTVPVAANNGFAQWTLNLVGDGTVDIGRVRLRKVT